MAEFHFIRPLWLLSAMPVLLVWWRVYRKQDPFNVMRGVIDPHLLEHLKTGDGRRARLRPVHALLLLWLFLVVAISGPAWRIEPSPFADEEAGLVVLLRASGSMAATDVQPNRLERAKFKLQDLLEARGEAPTALIVYSGSAHLVMPLTRDRRILATMIADLEPGLMPVDGDALPAAIERAETLLQRAGVPGSAVVLADTVTSTPEPTRLPLQFLSIGKPGMPVDPGLQDAARHLNAAVVAMTADASDVERIARRAGSELKAVSASDGQIRWKDGGYALLPLIALCGLLWARKGWVV